MWIPIAIYIWLIVSIVVFLLTTACLIVFNTLGRNVIPLDMRTKFNNRVFKVWGGSLWLGIVLCGLAWMLGVGPHIFVTIKNNILYGVKGCPCQPVEPLYFSLPGPVLPNRSANRSAHEYIVEAFYTIQGIFGTSELVTCHLDYISNPTLKDLDAHFTAKYPEWKSRPHRAYYLPFKGTNNKRLNLSDDISTYANKRILLHVGKTEQPLHYSLFKQSVDRMPKVVHKNTNKRNVTISLRPTKRHS